MKAEFLKFASKATFVLVLSIFGVIVSSFLVYQLAIEPASKDSIDDTFTVEGMAKRKVNPDSASITIGSYERGNDVAKLQESVNSKVNATIEDLKNMGIPEEKIQTSNYSISPELDPEGRQVISHFVNVEITVTINDTSAEDSIVNEVIESAVSNGLNEVRSLYFFVENEEEILKQLELEAIEDAKENAEEKADAIGLKLGDIKNVQNYSYTPFFSRYEVSEVAMDSASSKGLSIQPGQVELSNSVTLVYEIK